PKSLVATASPIQASRTSGESGSGMQKLFQILSTSAVSADSGSLCLVILTGMVLSTFLDAGYLTPPKADKATSASGSPASALKAFGSMKSVSSATLVLNGSSKSQT